ncbi:ABC transporter ATP-binding protein [Streptococcus iners]|uniref:ABC transporter ATP-binding protein n=1 Tax=Streptococcus iners subsp. hyiners TaxID=3028083 RepID=A0AA97A265_9STRE|nr:ABC transporter ATP-binding protein [Streptococcus sp. 29892]MCK4029701.1 ABC transporter ATP-binding protein [Streptococcus suis]WNY48470.1 ABC transporter ATP-binding protein [Streptococcus sp. 29892]
MVTISAKDLELSYGQKTVLSELSIEIPSGKISGIIGPNGCGKSTLLKALSRILPADKGAVYLDGKDLQQIPTKEIAKQLSLLPQVQESLGGIRVYDLVSYGRFPHQNAFGRLTELDREKIDWALKVTQTMEFAQVSVQSLSGGQRQRVWIAMALAQDTDTIFLDEPTTYLDMQHQLEVLQLLRKLNQENGKTIVMVLHDINHAARFSDCLIAMKDGQVLHKGSVDEVITVEHLRQIFDIEAEILPASHYGYPILATYTRTKHSTK